MIEKIWFGMWPDLQYMEWPHTDGRTYWYACVGFLQVRGWR